ncbi:MAG TPA: CHAD domain-containing protein [Terriglobia bacterium]|nr:CHAD domain-containing protein [Terriglobia bacterium]
MPRTKPRISGRRKPEEATPRQLWLRGAPEPPAVPALSEQVLAIARHHLDRFASLEAKVLKGENAEAIHDIRVASRRLQQVLDLLYAPAPARIRKLRRAIRRCRKALSLVRNCDVLAERAARVLKRKRVRRRPAWEAFQEYLAARRTRCFRKAIRRLEKLNLPGIYIQLRKELEGLREALPSVAPAGGGTAPLAADLDAALRQRLGAALQETWQGLESSLRQAREQREARLLHAVRIAGKKTRYLIEVIHRLGAPDSQRPLQYLRRLQQQLGDWHDLEVQEEMMLEMVAGSGMLRERLELAMEVERLVLQNRRRKRRYEERFWETAGSSERWEHLNEWVRAFLAASPPQPSRKPAQSIRWLASSHHLRAGKLHR